ncbi:hypothetical protein [Corynebacterium halotolerans]|uniref:hypothetical protein n=1 Tax=Corynebacterium halotolerans TaxID=225326 RepID=UPI003CEB9DBC
MLVVPTAPPSRCPVSSQPAPHLPEMEPSSPLAEEHLAALTETLGGSGNPQEDLRLALPAGPVIGVALVTAVGTVINHVV